MNIYKKTNISNKGKAHDNNEINSNPIMFLGVSLSVSLRKAIPIKNTNIYPKQ